MGTLIFYSSETTRGKTLGIPWRYWIVWKSRKTMGILWKYQISWWSCLYGSDIFQIHGNSIKMVLFLKSRKVNVVNFIWKLRRVYNKMKEKGLKYWVNRISSIWIFEVRLPKIYIPKIYHCAFQCKKTSFLVVSPSIHSLLWFQKILGKIMQNPSLKNLGNTMHKSVPIKIHSEKPWKNNRVEITPFLYLGKSARIEDLQKSLRILQFPQGIFSEEDLSGARW